MSELSKEELKEIFKESIKEWLDEKAAQFGKWTLKWIGAAIFAYGLWFLASNGFLKG